MKRTPEQTARARELRRNQTNAERAMWARLRNRQAEGAKFKRQWPIGPFIVTTQPSPFQGRGNLVAVDYQMWHHHHLPCREREHFLERIQALCSLGSTLVRNT